MCLCACCLRVYSVAVSALGDNCVSVLVVFGVASVAVTALGDTCVSVRLLSLDVQRGGDCLGG